MDHLETFRGNLEPLTSKSKGLCLLCLAGSQAACEQPPD